MRPASGGHSPSRSRPSSCAISFGVLAEPVIGAVATLAMSAFVFAGSAQFGSVAVLARRRRRLRGADRGAAS